MAVNKQAIKARIKSINATKKITSAMQLIANAKLAKQRNEMEKNKEYATLLRAVINDVLAKNSDVDSKYLKIKTSQKSLYIVFTSDLGLCGGYNANMGKLALESIKQDDDVIVVGTKLFKSLKKKGLNVINEFQSVDDVTIDIIKDLVDIALLKYLDNEIGSIKVIYTEFINTMTFEAKELTILPVEIEKTNMPGLKKETIFEPSADEILNNLIPMMVQNITYSLLLETKTAEQGARRLAMDAATTNAEELNDKLVLAYNQARQSAITQEITEIVAGADAI